MSSQPARVWSPPTSSPYRRTRRKAAANPFKTPNHGLNGRPKCWNRYPSHIIQAANRRANPTRIVRRNGGVGGQKRRAVWRNGKGAERLRSRFPGKTGQFAGKDEVRKNAEGKWVYV